MKFNFSLVITALLGSIAGTPATQKGNLRLIEVTNAGPAQWMNDTQVIEMIKKQMHYLDITDQQEAAQYPPVANEYIVPKALKYQNTTSRAQKKIKISRPRKLLTKLTKYHTRFYSTKTGVKAARFIKNVAELITWDYDGDVSVEYFDHPWAQPSVIVSIPGNEIKDEIVVIGAHLDSMNFKDPVGGRSPGADDDGTGVVTLLEVLKTLVSTNFKPKRTLEFQFYAAEEVGLKGSQAIAHHYKRTGKKVVAMYQQEMAGYKPPSTKTILTMTDYVDKDLLSFVKLLFTTYTPYPVMDGECGWPCSDHVSYNLAGYRTVISSEPDLARGYHTERDLVEDIDFDYIKSFIDVVIAFAVEIAEPYN